MAMLSISITRVPDMELVDVFSYNRSEPATDRAWRRPLNYEMLIGSHLPDKYWHTSGALATVILRAEPNVEKISLWTIASGTWIADADIYDIRPYVRRGEGATPVEALVALVRELYRY